jgi:SAM-dependent methyltransferase
MAPQTNRTPAGFSAAIRSLARQAMKAAAISPVARHIARARVSCPVDYMRCAEFDGVLRELTLSSPMTVLDVSSPQWFSFFLAERYPGIDFRYINIVPAELEPYHELAAALRLGNLDHRIADIRKLEIADDTYDRVISISVIEHIYPLEGGDVQALREIARVLKPGGELVLTVPYKDKANVVFLDGPVYERDEPGKNFFAREYDEETFARLVAQSGMALESQCFICERRGLLAVDYYDWGPGKNTFLARVNSVTRNALQRLLGVSLDEWLAGRYLVLSDRITDRVVNIVAKLRRV